MKSRPRKIYGPGVDEGIGVGNAGYESGVNVTVGRAGGVGVMPVQPL